MSVRFDAAGCVTALTAALTGAVKQLAEEYLLSARSHMRTPEGAESLHEGDVELLAGWIAATVVGGAYAAMDNYGRGSLMDANNLARIDYYGSELWNPVRADLAIRSRPPGSYTNIFGETVVSRSRRGGYNLEQKDEKYAPWPPSHALETAAKWMFTEDRPRQVILAILAGFPWARFIIATPD